MLQTRGNSVRPGVREIGDRRLDFFGLPLDAVSIREMVEHVRSVVDHGAQAEHACLGPTTLARALDDLVYREAMWRHRFVTADGQSVVWAARLLGCPIPERVAGSDLMMELLRLAHERAYRVYLLGAEPDVLADAEQAIRRGYPGLRVVGRHHGFFAPAEEDAVVADIAASGAQLLFVALPTPQKELFAIRHRDALGVNFTIGVGGMFDIVSGRIRRAPVWARKLALEWVFRVAQEPRRLLRRYVVVNARFVGLVIRELLGGRYADRLPTSST